MAEYEHMHTVPAGYLAGFADLKASKKKPHVWRFERGNPEPKPLSVQDICVSQNIYAVKDSQGNRDPVIERDVLGGIDDAYCQARNRLKRGQSVSYGDCRALSQFVVFQLMRTDRALQLLRDHLRLHGEEFAPDDPQKLMVTTMLPHERLLWLMRWEVWQVEDDDVLITTDNPATMWSDRGDGAELGVGFSEPGLVLSLPMTSRLCFVARQTKETIAEAAKLLGSADDKLLGTPLESNVRPRMIDRRTVHRLNQTHVSNGDRYAISSYDDARLRRFMVRNFRANAGPVRRSDRKPIGSPF